MARVRMRSYGPEMPPIEAAAISAGGAEPMLMLARRRMCRRVPSVEVYPRHRGRRMWKPVLRPGTRLNQGIGQDDDSKTGHPTLEPTIKWFGRAVAVTTIPIENSSGILPGQRRTIFARCAAGRAAHLDRRCGGGRAAAGPVRRPVQPRRRSTRCNAANHNLRQIVDGCPDARQRWSGMDQTGCCA
jgi:hypothetical protein